MRVNEARSEEVLVYQSNALIMRRTSLTLPEQRLLLAIIAQIKPEDEDFRTYEISVRDFSEMCGRKGKSIYDLINKIVVPFARKTVKITMQNGNILVTHWFSSAEYKVGQGTVEFSFDPKLKPCMLRLRDQLNYTQIPLGTILSMPGIYSSRIYEICSAHAFKDKGHGTTFTVKVDELREMLGVPPDRLQPFKNFNNVAIQPSLKLINERTPLNVSVELERHGHRYVSEIRFTVFKKVSPTSVGTLPALLHLVKPAFQDSPAVIMSIQDALKANVWSLEQLKNIIKAANIKHGVKSYPAYLRTALVKGYGRDGNSNPKGKRHPYAGRQVRVLSVLEMGIHDVAAGSNGKPVVASLEEDGSLWLDGQLRMSARDVTMGLRNGTVQFL